MSEATFDLNAYLERIKYQGTRDVSYETLKALHTAHVFNVPFECLDAYLRKPILLDPESLFKKIVTGNRGGYCFEMNGLFAYILRELGFKVTTLLARVFREPAVFSAKTHMVILVEIDGKKWLADVGFGGNGICEPVLFEEGLEQSQYTNTYKIVKDEKLGYILQYKTEDGYTNMYVFTLEECYPQDYILSNHFTSTYPESWFTKVRIFTRPTGEGRVTLVDGDLKIAAGGKVTECKMASDAEYNETLKKYFGIDLNLSLAPKTTDNG